MKEREDRRTVEENNTDKKMKTNKKKDNRKCLSLTCESLKGSTLSAPFRLYLSHFVFLLFCSAISLPRLPRPSILLLCSSHHCLHFLPLTSLLLLSCLTLCTSVSSCFHHHGYSTASVLCCHGDWGRDSGHI